MISSNKWEKHHTAESDCSIRVLGKERVRSEILLSSRIIKQTPAQTVRMSINQTQIQETVLQTVIQDISIENETWKNSF